MHRISEGTTYRGTQLSRSTQLEIPSMRDFNNASQGALQSASVSSAPPGAWGIQHHGHARATLTDEHVRVQPQPSLTRKLASRPIQVMQA
jgi:hypothetical protein